jgi:putative transposase
MSRFDISQHRACRLACVDPKTVLREPVPDHPEIRSRMHEIASERRRFW